MGLLETLKGLLGLDTARNRGADRTSARSRDAGVTVEREPSTATEDAVKGTDAGAASDDDHEAPTGESAAATAESAGEAAPSGQADEPLTAIDGIGPAYEERLQESGITSVTDLAAADPDELAEESGISSTRVARWIEAANSR